MIKKLVLRFIRGHLAAYLALPDSSANIEIILSKGSITLHNVPLKPVPLFSSTMLTGTIGTLHLTIPYAHLSTQAITITASNLSLALVSSSPPIRPASSSSSSSSISSHTSSPHPSSTPPPTTESAKHSTSHLLDNVHLTLSNLTLTLPSAHTLHLDSLSLFTCTTPTSIQPAHVTRSTFAQPLYRAGKLLHLSLFTTAPPQTQILPPTTLTLHITQSSLGGLSLHLSGPQSVLPINLAALSDFSSLSKLIPPPPPKRTLSSFLASRRRPCNWKTFMQAFRDRRDYLALSAKHATASLAQLEARLPPETVTLFRAFARAQVHPPRLLSRLRRRHRRQTPAAQQALFEQITAHLSAKRALTLAMPQIQVQLPFQAQLAVSNLLLSAKNEAAPTLQCSNFCLTYDKALVDIPAGLLFSSNTLVLLGPAHVILPTPLPWSFPASTTSSSLPPISSSHAVTVATSPPFLALTLSSFSVSPSRHIFSSPVLTTTFYSPCTILSATSCIMTRALISLDTPVYTHSSTVINELLDVYHHLIRPSLPSSAPNTRSLLLTNPTLVLAPLSLSMSRALYTPSTSILTLTSLSLPFFSSALPSFSLHLALTPHPSPAPPARPRILGLLANTLHPPRYSIAVSSPEPIPLPDPLALTSLAALQSLVQSVSVHFKDHRFAAPPAAEPLPAWALSLSSPPPPDAPFQATLVSLCLSFSSPSLLLPPLPLITVGSLLTLSVQIDSFSRTRRVSLDVFGDISSSFFYLSSSPSSLSLTSSRLVTGHTHTTIRLGAVTRFDLVPFPAWPASQREQPSHHRMHLSAPSFRHHQTLVTVFALTLLSLPDRSSLITSSFHAAPSPPFDNASAPFAVLLEASVPPSDPPRIAIKTTNPVKLKFASLGQLSLQGQSHPLLALRPSYTLILSLPTLLLTTPQLVLSADSLLLHHSTSPVVTSSRLDLASLALSALHPNTSQLNPLIEPLNAFALDFSSSDTTTSLSLHLPTPLKINLSPALVQVLSTLLTPRPTPTPPTHFSNLTNLPVLINNSLHLPAYSSLKTPLLTTSTLVLSIPNYHPLTLAPPQSHVTTVTLPLYPVHPASDPYHLISLSITPRSISLHSNVLIRNNTDLAVDLLLLPESSLLPTSPTTTTATLLVPPLESIHLPLTSSSNLALKPSIAASFSPSLSLSQLSAPLTLSLPPYTLALQPLKQDSFTRLVIHPPVTLTNALPVPISFRLVDDTNRRFSLVPGASLPAYTSLTTPLSLCVRGSAWSPAIALSQFCTAMPLHVEDVDGKQLQLLVDILPGESPSITRRVIVKSRAWLLNRSNLALSFQSNAHRLFDAVNQAISLNAPALFDAASVLRPGTLVELRHDADWVPARISRSRPDNTYDVALHLSPDEDDEPVMVGGVDPARLRVPLSSDYTILSDALFSVRVDSVDGSTQSQWSQPFSVEQARAGGGALLLKRTSTAPPAADMLGDKFCFAVDVEASPLIPRTPVIVFRSLFELTNATPHHIVLADVHLNHRILIQPLQTRTIHCGDLKLRFALEDPTAASNSSPTPQWTRSGYAFTGPLLLNSISSESIKCCNKISGHIAILAFSITMDKNQFRLRLAPDSGSYAVLNTSTRLVFFSHLTASNEHNAVESLAPNEEKPFGLDRMLASNEARLIEIRDSLSTGKCSVRVDALNLLPTPLGTDLVVAVQPRGFTKLVVISDQGTSPPSPSNLARPRLGSSDVSIRQVFVKCAEVLVSLVEENSPSTRELALLCFKGLELASVRQEHSPDDVDYTLLFDVKYFQLDNCLLNARFPVVVWPQKLSTTFCRVFCSGRRFGSDLVMLSEVRVAVQPADVFLEELWVWLVQRWWRSCLRRIEWPARPASTPIKLVIDLLQFEGLRLSLSMQRLVDQAPEQLQAGLGESSLTLTDVDRASVVVKPVEVRRAIMTPAQAFAMTRAALEREFQANLVRLVTSTELISSLVAPGFGGGPRPAEGSLYLGSLSQHAAFATLDSASKSFGALGSGLALLTFDSGFVAARRAAIIDDRPEDLAGGLALAVKSLGLGLVEGVGGVLTGPILGAVEAGAQGFVLGAARGIVGVAVKPAVAVFDSIASVLAGARTSTAALDAAAPPRRHRLPRAVREHDLVEYDTRAALVQELLVRVWGWARYQSGKASQLDFELMGQTLCVVNHGCKCLCLDYAKLAGHVHGARGGVDVVWEFDGRAVLQAWPVEGNEVDVLLKYPEGVFVGSSSVHAHLNPQVLQEDVVALKLDNKDDCRVVLNRLLRSMEEAAGGLQQHVGRLFGLTTGRTFVSGGRGGGGRVVGVLPSALPWLGWCFVHKVDEDSPAARAGFAVGDCIVACLGRALDVSDVDGLALHDALARLPDGAEMLVRVQRGDKLVELNWKL